MQKVLRGEILDFVTYEERRAELRTAAMAEKAVRRVHVGQNRPSLFEKTTLTACDQILEMVRAKRMVRESDIAHEIETYNELLGGPGELGCTLLVEIPTAEERDVLLRKWREVPTHLYARLADGRKVRRSWTSGRRTRSGSPACSI